MEISIDTSELRALVADMSQAPAEVRQRVPAVIAKGALSIKDDLAEQMQSSRHFKGFAVMSYDLIDGGMGAEIGPEKGGPGAGANIAYFGTSKGGGTVEDPVEALNREEPKITEALGDLFEDLF